MLTYSQLMYFRKLWGIYQDDYFYLCRVKKQFYEAYNGISSVNKQCKSMSDMSEKALGNGGLENKLELIHTNIEYQVEKIINETEHMLSQVAYLSAYIEQNIIV